MRWRDRDQFRGHPVPQQKLGWTGWSVRRIIWLNFLTSIWIAIVMCARQFISFCLHAENIWSYYGSFAVRTFAFPIVALFFEAILFHAVRQKDGARPLAFTLGILALCLSLVKLLTADMLQQPVHWRAAGIIAYVGVSHLLYSVIGKEGSASHESILIIEKEQRGDDPAGWWKHLGGR